MNYAHLHLIVNHVPVVGIPFTLAIWIASAVAKNRAMRNTALVGFIACALAGGVATLTGEPAEEAVEHLPGVSESVIEPHEDAAQWGWIAAGTLGVCALVALAIYRKADALPRGLIIATTILAVWASAVMLRVANLGGKIRHTEIRADSGGAAGQGGEAAGSGQEAGEKEESEDDDD